MLKTSLCPYCGSIGLLVFLATCPLHANATEIDGTLRDVSGAPLANMRLTVQDGQGAVVASVNSDAQGHFDFPSVPAGSYVVMATQDGAMLGSMTVTVGAGNESIHKDLILRPEQAMNVVIAAQRLQEARNNLSPQTGTNAYQINNQAITEMPQGADTSFDKVLEQAPGVAQDSFGQTHIRGEHANLQYRLNGILLPEGISGFGQVVDSRIVDKATLLDGALPAQYGYRTAGVVDIQTKNGFDNSGEAEMYGGSHGTLEPSVQYGGTYNSMDYFLSASHLTSDLGVENPTSSTHAIHDHTEQNKQFAYMSYMIDPMQRVEMVAGSSLAHFQIPNSPGQTPNFTDGNISGFDSSQLNERQFESNQYATVAWQGQNGPLDVQIAPYIRNSETHFIPDPIGDLVFNGVASDVKRTDLAVGVQADGSYKLNAGHTLRSGFSLQQEYAATDNSSLVFPGDSTGQTSTTPFTVTDNSHKDGQLYGVYLQDEWKLTGRLTMNYGARFDVVNAFVDESQLSPRLGFVYKADDRTTLHAGYARYFTPPPLELVSSSLAKFDGTTNQPVISQNDPVKSERSHNFDVGATHQLTDEIQIGADAYYKLVHDLLDEGQFGQALVYTPFNYEHGKIYGLELTASYTGKVVKAYANFAASRAVGEKIVSAQFNFNDPAEVAFINNNFVHLDHDQTYTASGGVSYKVLPQTEIGLDSVFGSGLRSSFANSQNLPWYTQFDASLTQDLDLFPKDKTQLRFTVVNLFDTSYELRDGSGIGVGAPQWGPRRGVFVGLTQDF